MTNLLHEPWPSLSIRVDSSLIGSTHALQFGDGPIIVSPAMYDLMMHASPGELRLLLASIRIKKLPAMPSVHDPLPMVTKIKWYGGVS